MLEVQAPNPLPVSMSDFDTSIFLAGSIEMGKAEPWQAEVASRLSNASVVILNPRRDDWDVSWVQDIDNDQFRTQVMWELDNISRADFVVFYFDPNTQSPITLLELGRQAAEGNVGVVCCPPGFWRRGNIQVLCAVHGIKLVSTKEEFYDAIDNLVGWNA